MTKCSLLILLLASWMALGGLVLGQTSKPAEVPELNLPKIQGGKVVVSAERNPVEFPALDLPKIQGGKVVTSTERQPLEFPELNLPEIRSGKVVISVEKPPFEFPVLQLPQAQNKGDILNLSDFSGGLNLKAHPTQLKDNEAQVLQNAWWDKFGALGRRKGYTHFSIDDSAMGINGLYRYYQQDGDRYLLVGGDTTLYYCQDDSTTLNRILGDMPTGKEYYFTHYKDLLYGVIEDGAVFYFDGDTVKDVGIRIDSGEVISQTADGCTTIFTVTTTDWTTDKWVGYTGCTYDTNQQDETVEYQCGLITANTSTTIECAGRNMVTLNNDHPDIIWIYPFFYDRPVLCEGVLDTILDNGSCKYELVDSSWTDDFFKDKFYVIEFTSGDAAGCIMYIYGNSTTSLTVGDNPKNGIAKGDEYKIYQKTFYKGRYIATFKNRLILAGDSTNYNIIYYSETDNPRNFDPDNKFTTYTPDGGVITGLMPLYNDQKGFRSSPDDRLGILKENTVMATGSNFIPYIVASGVGAIAPRSIVNAEGYFVGFAHSTGYYSTDFNTVTLLSEKIKPFWDNINPTAINLISAGYYDRHILISVPYDTFTYPCTTLIYNIDNKSWSGANISASVFANQWGLDDTIKFLWGRPDSGFIQRYGVSDFDDGDSIVLSFKSKEFDLGDLSQRKTFRNMLLSYDVTSPIILTLNFYKDFGTTATWSTTFTDSGKDVRRVNISPAVVGKTLSWGLSSKDPDITIGNVQFNFQLVGGY